MAWKSYKTFLSLLLGDSVVLGISFPFPFSGPGRDISGGPVVSEGNSWHTAYLVPDLSFSIYLTHQDLKQMSISNQGSSNCDLSIRSTPRQVFQACKERKGETAAKLSLRIMEAN